jgi:UDP-N-acetylglucosamine 2-epimerase
MRVLIVADASRNAAAAAVRDALAGEGIEAGVVVAEDLGSNRESASAAAETAAALLALEPLLASSRPAAVALVGDGNGALAAALVATKLEIPVVHVGVDDGDAPADSEAEINRRLIERLSQLRLPAREEAAAAIAIAAWLSEAGASQGSSTHPS